MPPRSRPRLPALRLPASAQPVAGGVGALQIKWSKAPCRFCGTGCGVMVGVKDGRVVATHGDMQAEVNRGLNCVKGYFLSKIMYGADRLTTPLMRKRNGVYDKDGEFEPVSWDEAFDVMADRLKQVLKAKGPTAVGMFGSGQWTIFEGYAATKLMRAGFRSNNLDPNARHCMASAAYAFMRTFGMDEPMGCYDDFEHADAFVLWGSNMAEMHPILWTRLADRRLGHPHVKVAVLSTFTHRSMDLADIPIVFKPGTDLAILNYIANHIIKTGRVNKEFVETTRPSCAARPISATVCGRTIRARKRPRAQPMPPRWSRSTSRRSRPWCRNTRLEKVAELTGVEKGFLEELAELYADPNRKVMSLWTMGFNQHVRGVWANQLVYNIHLLTGKISEPGNSPFSLTGQPSACGTAREVGTFAHRLPADMVVTNPEHRKRAEEIWKLPAGLLPEKPGYHAVEQDRMLKDGKLNFYWVQVNNNIQAAPNTSNETYPGYRNPDNFIVVSDAYPTITAMSADIILPAAMWVEKEGAYGNAERRTHVWHQLVQAPGEARSDLWQLVEFSKRFTTDEVWPAAILEANPEYRGKTLYEVLFRNGDVDKFPLSEIDPDYENNEAKEFGFYIQKGLFEEYAAFRPRPRARPCALRPLPSGARPALAGRRRQGDALALSRGPRSLCQAGRGRKVLRPAGRQGGHPRRALRAAGGIARRRVRHLAGHRTRARTLAFRLDDHARAGTLPGLPRRALLHERRRRPQARHQSGRGGAHHFAARRDPLAHRNARPQPDAERRGLRAVVRCQPADQQGHARRHRSDLEADGFQEMRGQDRSGRMRMRRSIPALVAVALLCAGTALIAQTAAELTGPKSPMETVPAEPVPKWVTDDVRQMRAYPEQPPVIPHSIDGYQLSVNTNRCLSCHKREFTQGSGAPMISVTHS